MLLIVVIVGVVVCVFLGHFAFSYHKTKNLNNHHAVMVVIKVIGH